jgi:hypothetical protein
MTITVESMVRRALIGIATVGILAVTVGVETANAQPYRRYGPARTYTSQAYTPQAAARFAARAFRALFRFPTRTVRKPPAVAALATIEPSRTGEKKTDFGSPGEALLRASLGACRTTAAPS